MNAGSQARRWREGLGLTRKELGELIGYDQMTIYWMERGAAPPGRGSDGTIKPWVWLRYQRACQGLDAELRSQTPFKW